MTFTSADLELGEINSKPAFFGENGGPYVTAAGNAAPVPMSDQSPEEPQKPDVLRAAYSCKDCERRALHDEIRELRDAVYDQEQETKALRYELKLSIKAKENWLDAKIMADRTLFDCRQANNLAAIELDKARAEMNRWKDRGWGGGGFGL
jgi:hypothetical protein